jgi:hypothetical protein
MSARYPKDHTALGRRQACRVDDTGYFNIFRPEGESSGNRETGHETPVTQS